MRHKNKILPIRYTYGWGKNLVTEAQRTTILDLFPLVDTKTLVLSDGNVVVDCDDGRPIVIYRGGDWEFI